MPPKAKDTTTDTQTIEPSDVATIESANSDPTSDEAGFLYAVPVTAREMEVVL